MGKVFSIEEFSIYDGPGIRTSVFLKGCPLHCSWCHNPEGQSVKSEIVRSPNGCLECGACERWAQKEGERTIYTENSIKSCPRSLLRVCGDDYTPEELFKKVMKNRGMLQKGGVTFSGGEPFFQKDFLFACLKIFKGHLHTAVQTSGFTDSESFKRALSLADMFLYDLKIIDEGEHICHTGVSNKKILENYKTLSQSGKDFITRIPLIPTVTDTEKNIEAIALFMSENGVKYAELMPYNKYAGSKYTLAGRKYMPTFDETIECCPREDIFKSFGIDIKIL